MHDLPLNTMYIDLNSCFATIEQQARPMLRGRPVAITNRLTKNACIVAASYEAKACGVKVGMRKSEADAICKDLIFAETEPDKYIFVHNKLRNIMNSYSSDIAMKSIDEGVINLAKAPQNIKDKSHDEIAQEIKARLKSEVGCHMRCNIGISSNRFLAKLAAELHKPDGYDKITPLNQREIFANLKLQDLPGINTRMEARLNAVGIFTPLQFLDTSEETLTRMVCHSIDGNKWYRRLRGIEVDAWESDIKSIGRQYVLESCKLSHDEIEARLVHLTEDVGRRLRSKNLYARGIFVWINTYSELYLHKSIILKDPIQTDEDIIRVAKKLYSELPAPVQIIGITLYKIQDSPNPQISLYQDKIEKSNHLSQAKDAINQRFGNRTIHCGDSFDTKQIQTKIPFGSTRYLGY